LVLGVCAAIVVAEVCAGVLLVITCEGIVDLVAGAGHTTGSRRRCERDRATEPGRPKQHGHHQQPQGHHAQGAGDVTRAEHQRVVILQGHGPALRGTAGLKAS